MKKIEVIVNKDEAEAVEKVLDQLELLSSTSEVEIKSKKYTFYSTFSPDELADEAMEKLSETIDLDKKENVISIYKVSGVTSPFLDKLKEKVSKNKSSKNPTEELIEKTDAYTRLTKEMVAITLAATIVAIAGLFLNNVILIIGAIILPPMLGPINALAVNANLGKPKKMLSSQASILILLGIVISVAAISTYVAQQFIELSLTEQIFARSYVTVFDVVVALVLGLAAGLVFRIALTENLFGVAISAALLPPSAVAGIQLAFSNFNGFFGAIILVFVNLFSLEFGCTLMFRLLGVSPRNYYKKGEGKKNAVYSLLFLAALLVILTILILIPNLVPSSR
ncbi:MAG: TIGR00341 family protein [Candidatus Bathyarchaeia archaeon]|jgi:uncharacterized hydrophobic protein (TIGR00341 family)